MAKRLRRIVVATLSVAGLLFLGFVAMLAWPREGCGGGPILRDIYNLKGIVGLVITAPQTPLKDGELDPYAFVRSGDVVREQYGIFRSVRSGTGPTDEEIERGDYTNFPWERYRGDGKPIGRFPLLWEKEPDKRGGRIVGFADGSAEYCESDSFAIHMVVGCVVSTRTIPMKDGQFDPYAFVRDGLIPASLLRSASGAGPTDAEILRGDYTNLPWERYRGDGRLADPPFALLWSKEPGDDGKRRTGFSDGNVRPR